MKRFLIFCAAVLGVVAIYYCLFRFTSLIDPLLWVTPKEPIAVTREKQIYLNGEDAHTLFEIKGVDLGAGIPGHFATEFAIDYETYMEWFALIQQMNANTIRIYTISAPEFYHAFYDYNKDNPDPLYLIQGVWVEDSVMRASNHAYAPEFIDVFTEDCRIAIDVIHGRRIIGYHSRYGYGMYQHDVSPWCLGYIIGVEWEPDLVLYTDDVRESMAAYTGEYLYTDENATAFEAMFARVGNEMFRYETLKYGQQRLLAFSNWPETDPLHHDQWRLEQNTNLARVDVEHIHGTDKVESGMFASYHIYPYYPAFLDFEERYVNYVDEYGQNNPYLGYLRAINEHHSIPVIVSEFGLPSSRGIARINLATGMNQGNLSESEQAERLPVLYENIKRAGCAGAVVFAWQDEWFKRTWNTWPGVDLSRNAFWNDYQTNEQSFGLITFDPGAEESIVYVDGDTSEWAEVEPLCEADGVTLKMLYDEKYLYFYVRADALRRGAKLYLPIDLTPLSGAYSDSENGLSFTRPVDFVVRIDGEDNSKVFVQEYYDFLYATERREIWDEDGFIYPPEPDSSTFNLIYQYLRGKIHLLTEEVTDPWLFPTGELTAGNGNPSSPDFNSLTDFCLSGDTVEIRLPWLLLNFSDPSTMQIHADYYEHYGVEDLGISEMFVEAVAAGVDSAVRTGFGTLKLKGWNNWPTSHMRLKEAYYTMREAFAKE